MSLYTCLQDGLDLKGLRAAEQITWLVQQTRQAELTVLPDSALPKQECVISLAFACQLAPCCCSHQTKTPGKDSGYRPVVSRLSARLASKVLASLRSLAFFAFKEN